MAKDILHIHKFSATLGLLILNLSRTGRSHKQAVSIFADSCIVVIALWAAFSLRLGMPFDDLVSTWHLFLFLPVATVFIFMSLGIYRWVVRSSNLNLFRQLVKASIASALFLVVFSSIVPPDRVMPRSLFIIYGLLLVPGTCGIRLMWHALFNSGNRGEPIAIYGTGSSGRALYSSLTEGDDFRPVMFLDDNQKLKGATILGVPVESVDDKRLQSILASKDVEKVILAMPDIGATAYKEKIDNFKAMNLPLLTVPTQTELLTGAATLGEVRDISINDILGRTEIEPDAELLGRCVTNKNVLVTGGGGSIGSELCRQLLLQKPKKLVIVDQSEFNLYCITEEIQGLIFKMDGDAIEFKPRLGSVTNSVEMSELMATEKIDTVYHAAAYKHVPVIESQPEQGIVTNIFGTLNVLNAALQCETENFVLISTDKAVRPTNSMGATKRIAELILQAKSKKQSHTKISMVRFGNVLGSSGSVVPKFRKQIEQGGPITLTDPDVARFFMTIPEAAQLVLQASAIATGGDVFVLDMGEPVRIEDLAVSMVRLSGKKLARETGNCEDIDIVVEGLRPGEKMYEELFISGIHHPTKVTKVYTAEEVWLPWEELQKELQVLKDMCNAGNESKLRKALLSLAFAEVPKVSSIEKRKYIPSSLARNEGAIVEV